MQCDSIVYPLYWEVKGEREKAASRSLVWAKARVLDLAE